jgi:hypothetical protein
VGSQQLIMLHIDVVVITLHLLRIVGTLDFLLLIICIVEGYFSLDLLSTFGRRVIAIFIVAGILRVAKTMCLVPRLHILWIWAIVAIGTPTLRDTSKPITALLMITTIPVLIWPTKRFNKHLPSGSRVRSIVSAIEWYSPVLNPERSTFDGFVLNVVESIVSICSGTAFALAGTGIETWNVIFIMAIILLLPSTAFRYRGSNVAGLAVMFAGWISLIFWCWKYSSTCNDNDFELFLLISEALIAQFMMTYDIGIYYGIY